MNTVHYSTCLTVSFSNFLTLHFLIRETNMKNSIYFKTECGGETDGQLSRVPIYKGTNLQKEKKTLIFIYLNFFHKEHYRVCVCRGMRSPRVCSVTRDYL